MFTFWYEFWMQERITELGNWGKIYTSMFQRSMVGSGAACFALWSYCIANARPPSGIIELNPMVLGAIFGEKPETMQSALKKLCSADKDSFTKGLNGQRLVCVSGHTYRMVNWKLYRGPRSSEELREYYRVKQQEHRARKKAAKIKLQVMSEKPYRPIHV